MILALPSCTSSLQTSLISPSTTLVPPDPGKERKRNVDHWVSILDATTNEALIGAISGAGITALVLMGLIIIILIVIICRIKRYHNNNGISFSPLLHNRKNSNFNVTLSTRQNEQQFYYSQNSDHHTSDSDIYYVQANAVNRQSQYTQEYNEILYPVTNESSPGNDQYLTILASSAVQPPQVYAELNSINIDEPNLYSRPVNRCSNQSSIHI